MNANWGDAPAGCRAPFASRADIAFPSTEFALRRYLEDQPGAREDHYFTTVDRRLNRTPEA